MYVSDRGCTFIYRQTEEMEKAVDKFQKLQKLQMEGTELIINELAKKHFEDQTLLHVKLQSELDTLKEAQRREYRDWLMEMLEQNQAENLSTPK